MPKVNLSLPFLLPLFLSFFIFAFTHLPKPPSVCLSACLSSYLSISLYLSVPSFCVSLYFPNYHFFPPLHQHKTFYLSFFLNPIVNIWSAPFDICTKLTQLFIYPLFSILSLSIYLSLLFHAVAQKQTEEVDALRAELNKVKTVESTSTSTKARLEAELATLMKEQQSIEEGGCSIFSFAFWSWLSSSWSHF